MEEIKVQEEISQENIKNSQSIVTLHGDNSEISDNILSQKNTEFPIPPQYFKKFKSNDKTITKEPPVLITLKSKDPSM